MKVKRAEFLLLEELGPFAATQTLYYSVIQPTNWRVAKGFHPSFLLNVATQALFPVKL